MPDIQIPNSVIVALQIILAFGGAFVVAIWVSLIVWTFRDVRSRSRDIFAVLLASLMVVIFGPLGLLLYFLLRPPNTLAELYERSLEEEALLQDLEERAVCPGCRRKIEPDWQVCPECHTILKKECLNCGKLLHLRWSLCPYCVTPSEPVVAPQQDEALEPGFGAEQPVEAEFTEAQAIVTPAPAPLPANPELGPDPQEEVNGSETLDFTDDEQAADKE